MARKSRRAPSASVKKRTVNGKPAGWRVRWRDRAGNQLQRTFDTEKAAKAYRTTVEADLKRGTDHDPNAGEVTFKTYAEHWLEAIVKPNRKPKTYEGYESLLRLHVYPVFGDYPLNEIGTDDIEDLVASMQDKGLSASRIHQAMVPTRQVFKRAVRFREIDVNPAGTDCVDLTPVERHEAAYFDPGTVARIAEAMPTAGARLLVEVLGTTGLRWGEAAGLKVRHVDHLRRRLHIRETLSEASGKLHTVAPKNNQHRSVSVPFWLADELANFLQGGPDAYVFTTARVMPGTRKRPEGLPLRKGNFFKRVWKPTLVKLGLVLVDEKGRLLEDSKGWGPHTLRHSAISRMISEGWTTTAIQRNVGHSDPSVTLGRYGHMFEDDLDNLTERLTRPSASPTVGRPWASGGVDAEATG